MEVDPSVSFHDHFLLSDIIHGLFIIDQRVLLFWGYPWRDRLSWLMEFIVRLRGLCVLSVSSMELSHSDMWLWFRSRYNTSGLRYVVLVVGMRGYRDHRYMLRLRDAFPADFYVAVIYSTLDHPSILSSASIYGHQLRYQCRFMYDVTLHDRQVCSAVELDYLLAHRGYVSPGFLLLTALKLLLICECGELSSPHYGPRSP